MLKTVISIGCFFIPSFPIALNHPVVSDEYGLFFPLKTTEFYLDLLIVFAAAKIRALIRRLITLLTILPAPFPKLPIILMGDSLYASEPFMRICEEKGWDYLIRFKSGSIPGIAEEYEALRQHEMFGKGKESGRTGEAEFINEIDYNGRPVNVVRFRERKIVRKKETVTEFQWLTSLKVNVKNVEKVASRGRLRWKIENQGFNRQKHWSGDITHACSWDRNALKNHYLLMQISDFVRQLYEYFFLAKNQIKRTQKNISSTLLRDFGERLTGEDIFNAGLHAAFIP